jgi:alpha-ketoglutarate-dependent taurine dioxygenase
MVDFSESLMNAGRRTPLIIQGNHEHAGLPELMAARGGYFRDRLTQHGAILFRGFAVDSLEEFDSLASAFSNDRLSYTFQSSPRTLVGHRVYTATEYPAKLHIPLHSENSYTREWPLSLMFACLQPAVSGGETPIADLIEVTRALDPSILEEFESKGVSYIRHSHDLVDLPWQQVFQTDDREVVINYCRQEGIEFSWLEPGNVLSTTQRCQGVARHPKTGECVFFNQAHLFHVSSLGSEAMEAMIEIFGIDRLPRHARYGDGTEIPHSVLEEIRRVLNEHTVAFPWQIGDAMLIDNMQVAHGRRPFQGDRKVLAAFFEPFRQAV